MQKDQKSLIGTYNGKSINLTNISDIEIYQYAGKLTSVRVNRIHYTDEKTGNPDESKCIEFKYWFSDEEEFKSREETTRECEKLKEKILTDWNNALILIASLSPTEKLSIEDMN